MCFCVRNCIKSDCSRVTFGGLSGRRRVRFGGDAEIRREESALEVESSLAVEQVTAEDQYLNLYRRRYPES